MKELDPIERMLCFMIISLIVITVGSAILLPNDAQNYTLLAGVLNNFTGALIGRITKFSGSGPPPPGGQKETVTVEKQATPPEKHP